MKKKILSIIIGGAAAAMCVVCPVRAEETPTPAQTVYTTDTVNVREQPSIDSNVVTTFPKGTPIQRIEEGIKFDIVIIEDQIFYICNDYLSEIPIYNENDLRLLAAIIFEEAGNQCKAGQEAVGITVMNRVKSQRFPNTIEEVLYQKGQFFNPSYIDFYNKCLRAYDNGTIPQSCIEAAIYALDGNVIVNYNNQLIDLSTILFFSRYRSDCKVQIQDHQFA